MLEEQKKPDVKLDLRVSRRFKTWTITLGAIVILAGVALAALIIEHAMHPVISRVVSDAKSAEKKVEELISYMGVELLPVTDAMAQEFKLDSNRGALVNTVFNDSPAKKAGLERGDVITRFDRKAVTDVAQVEELISRTSPGDTVKVVVSRGGRSRNLYVTLGGTSKDTLAAARYPEISGSGSPYEVGAALQQQTQDQVRDPSTHVSDRTRAQDQITSPLGIFRVADRDQVRDPSTHVVGLQDQTRTQDQIKDHWGITVSPLTSQLSEQLGSRERKGVVVMAVVSGSKADRAGLRAGDLITEVNRKKTPDITSFYAAIAGADSVLLDVYSPASADSSGTGSPSPEAEGSRDRDRDRYITMDVNPALPPMATVGLVTAQSSGGSKVAVAASGNNFQSPLALRFGTATHFVIMDPDTFKIIEVVPNYRSATNDYRAYGIRAAQIVASHEADSVITAGIGPQAFDTLTLYNIRVFASGPLQTVSQVVEQYRNRQLAQLANPTIAGTGGYTRQSGLSGLNLTGGKPDNIPPMGKPEETNYTLIASNALPSAGLRASISPVGSTAGQAGPVDQCICPVCGAIVSHPAGIPCSQITCPHCGSRMLSANPAVKTGMFDLSLTAGPSGGGGRQTSMFNLSLTGGKPENIPPMGKPEETSYTLAGGKPENIPPMGKPEETSYILAGGGKPEDDDDDEEDEGGYMGIPPTIPPMGKPGANVVNIWQIAGPPTNDTQIDDTSTGGKPENIPPMQVPGGQTVSNTRTVADTSTGGKPENVPPPQVPGGSSGMRPEDVGAQNMAYTPSLSLSAGAQNSTGMSNRTDMCICPVCGKLVPHPIGVPCASLVCPDCGGRLTNPQSGVSPQNAPSGTGRVDLCVCPTCGKVIPHPPGTACSSLVCPDCGTRLANASAGNTLSPVTPYTVDPRLSTQAQRGAGAAGTLTLPGQSQGGGQGLSQGLNQSDVGGRSGSSGMGGPGGYCICPICGEIVPHEPGVTCISQTCPKCGSAMVRTDGMIITSDQPENRPLRSVSDRPGDKPPDITKSAVNLVTVGAITGKIAIAATGATMDSKIAPLFDRAPYYLIVGFGSFKALPNPNAEDNSGVGIQSAQLIVDEGAGALIANNISLEAVKTLGELKVKVYTGVTGTATQAVNWYESDRLQETTLGVGNPDEKEEGHGSSGMGMKEKQKFDNRTKAAL